MSIRGRPSKSVVREHLKEVLFLGGRMTAYTAHKHYIKLFAATTQRNIYYQLEKGLEKGEFISEEITEEGEYSWGTSARKKYYDLAKNIKPNFSKESYDYFQTIKINEKKGD
ncbi:hypothetical protein JXA48_00655 [Candidatus Woesearchaeota archaeon]|nr:hypothetical protein [Candidatus Woesearchaeota archaeon]